MKVVRHPLPGASDSAIAIGSFDGVHLGHQAIVAHLKRKAIARRWRSAILTFEPLPREHFAPAEAPARLTTLAERIDLLSHTALDTAYVERFDRRFASLTAAQFEERLRSHYGARWVMVGEDFRYGAGRAGDAASLAAAGARLGFEVKVIETVPLRGERISSTRVRAALAAGDLAQATRLLGRPYSICGRVVHGAKRGRELGFPTANVRLARAKPALWGVFAVK